ncbi:MAG: hypothetical protein HY778_08985 [Betaproteobacteria bacterium]|nr:hypothetical protein [Betaproteobacteria bacterium]
MVRRISCDAFERFREGNIELERRVVEVDDVTPTIILDFINEGVSLARGANVLEDRVALRRILRIWAARLVRLGGVYPGIDIDRLTYPLVQQARSGLHERDDLCLHNLASLRSEEDGGPKRQATLTFEEFANLEMTLPGLIRVLVVCHFVESPLGTLAKAVENNFRRGARYQFLISKFHAERELNGYYIIFRAMADMVRMQLGAEKGAEDLVSISRLTYNWTEYPYVFYEYRPVDEEPVKVIALRGDQKQEGIAQNYELVSPHDAESLLLAIQNGAPQAILIPVGRPEYELQSELPPQADKFG